MAEHDNRRDFSRVTIHIDAEIVCGEKVISGRLVDVSMRGMRLACDETLPLQSECSVTCFLGDSRESLLQIRANGKVVRVLDDSISIEITGIDLDSFEHLRNLVLMNADNGSQVEDELKSHIGLKKSPSE